MGAFMKKKLIMLGATLTALILEILPYGAVLNFANPEGEPHRYTYSYFDLTPFGYANFAPFIVAILTCVLLVLIVASVILKKALKKPIAAVSTIAAVLSLLPMLFGLDYVSFVGLLISAALICTAVISFIQKREEQS